MFNYTEILAAVLGATVGGVFHLLSTKKGGQLTDLIDDNDAFEVYSDSKAPDEIWNNFRKDFKSYNDLWQMELVAPEEYKEIHVNRYKDPLCGNYKFLFFIKKDLGQFDRFVRFQAMVHLDLSPTSITSDEFPLILRNKLKNKILPDTLSFIEIYLNDSMSPKQTFFRGYKEKEKSKTLQKVSLWYLSIDTESDEPHLILKSTDERFWTDLNKKWNTARKDSEKITGFELFEKYLQKIQP